MASLVGCTVYNTPMKSLVQMFDGAALVIDPFTIGGPHLIRKVGVTINA
jgi:hypothetical protein